MKKLCLSDVLKRLLQDNSLTANKLAVTLCIPTPTIHRLVTGEVQDPRLSTLTAIADYFDITIEQLVGRKSISMEKRKKHAR